MASKIVKITYNKVVYYVPTQMMPEVAMGVDVPGHSLERALLQTASAAVSVDGTPIKARLLPYEIFNAALGDNHSIVALTASSKSYLVAIPNGTNISLQLSCMANVQLLQEQYGDCGLTVWCVNTNNQCQASHVIGMTYNEAIEQMVERDYLH